MATDTVNDRSDGPDGRGPSGRFRVGNKLAKGNIVNRRMAELRAAALEAESSQRVAEVVGKLRELALEGDVAAAKVYMETVVGLAPQAVA